MSSKSLRLLFVDDDEDVLTMTKLLIAMYEKKALAVELFTASQGEEAIKIFDREMMACRKFDMVIMDVRMPPGMDGIETIRQMRQKHGEFAFVFYTAFSDMNCDQIQIFLGMDSKPEILEKSKLKTFFEQRLLTLN